MDQFPDEWRERALRLVLDNEGQHGSRWQAIMSISAKIGSSGHTLNEWVKKAEVDSGKRAGVSSEMAERMKVLERENRELRPGRTRSFARRQRILRWCERQCSTASALPVAARPPVEVMVGFIDAHRDAHGGPKGPANDPGDRWPRRKPICAVLPIAPSTYYDHLARRIDPGRLSDRARRDELLRPEIRHVFEENWSVYGARKIWRQLRREGFDVARLAPWPG